MNFGLHLLTTDRSPRPNYLAGTLASLRDSGLERRSDWELHLWPSRATDAPLIQAALAAVPLPAQVPPLADGEQWTQNQNLCRALRHAAGSDPRYVMVLEDDVVVTAGFLDVVADWVERFFADTPARLATFYTPYQEVAWHWQTTRRLGWWPYPVGVFYGLCCVLLRREEAAGLADSIERAATHGTAADIFLQSHYPETETFRACVPNLVQHVGAASGITPGAPVRQCPGFVPDLAAALAGKA